MSLTIREVEVRQILTRTSGYLQDVASHSLQPYRGCSFGSSLCGVGCYVQHQRHLFAGRAWGTFLDVRSNAAAAYRTHYAREQTWGRRTTGRFSIFCSSATDPFVPQEFRWGITRSLLETIRELPPDLLILQTHSHQVVRYLPLLQELRESCELRVHLSIETDQPRLPGLPPPASPVERRLESCATLRKAGIQTVVTVAPLLPIHDPAVFFARLAEVADAVIIDHFVDGDGSTTGARTQRTALPEAMAALLPESVTLAYRDRMVQIAQQHLPGRVGVGRDGFAGQWLPAEIMETARPTE